MYVYIYINSSYSLSKEQRGTWVTTCTKASSSGQRLESPTGCSSQRSQGAKSPCFLRLKMGKMHGESWMILSMFGFKNRSSNNNYWDYEKGKVPGNGVNLPLFGQDFVHLWSATCATDRRNPALSTMGSKLRSQSRHQTSGLSSSTQLISIRRAVQNNP